MKSKARIGFFALVVLVLPSTQSFGTNVTGGYFTVYSGPFGGFPDALVITAGGLNLYVPVRGDYWPANCFFCDPGTVVSVSGGAVGTELGVGDASNFGVVDWGNPDVPYESEIFFTAPSMWLNHGAGLYTVPFSFTGALCGFDPGTGTCVVDLPYLTGEGMVDASAEEPYGLGGPLYVDAFGYGFQTPEPGTLALFGSGVVGLAGVIRRKLEL